MTDPAFWPDLADTYRRAYKDVTGKDPARKTVLLCMAVPEFETNSGRAWPGTYNFGAVQLRSLTADELARFKAGTLKAGDRIPGNPGGVLHVDTHPPGIPYPVWFVAFDTEAEGVRYFLKMFLRPGTRAAVEAPMTVCVDVATQMYLVGYFEGRHAGARSVGKRALPLTEPEQANVNDYGAALQRIYDTTLVPALAAWDDEPTLPSTPAPPMQPVALSTTAGPAGGMPTSRHTTITFTGSVLTSLLALAATIEHDASSFLAWAYAHPWSVALAAASSLLAGGSLGLYAYERKRRTPASTKAP